MRKINDFGKDPNSSYGKISNLGAKHTLSPFLLHLAIGLPFGFDTAHSLSEQYC
jgi:hypothetical protein